MNLTTAQGKWLLRARAAGYEKGFRARYNRALGRLVELGYVECNPTSPGHWRVTESGISVRVAFRVAHYRFLCLDKDGTY